MRNLHAVVESEGRDRRITIKPFSLRILMVCGVALFLVGFFSTRDAGHPAGPAVETLDSPQSQPIASRANAASTPMAENNPPAVVHVVIRNMKFDPAIVEVKRGSVVEWKNDDITPHTATAASFDSGSIEPDKSWRHTFAEPGSIAYICTFHPDMKGAVTIK